MAGHLARSRSGDRMKKMGMVMRGFKGARKDEGNMNHG
ncbi:hypothetical protein AGRO_2596 [Agrobacterium sp. ATCC 31749]|nr:hypothetical protein AGRO_2596 [Agrobacterium sp. ATCC 31749]